MCMMSSYLQLLRKKDKQVGVLGVGSKLQRDGKEEEEVEEGMIRMGHM